MGQCISMPSERRNPFVISPALLLAACLCLFTIAQVARSLRFVVGSGAAFSRQHLKLTRNVLEEVSPRSAQPQAPDAIGLIPVVAVKPDPLLPRLTIYVPLWPMETWPIHRRVSPVRGDIPEPA
jgi:hypothetical protein